MERKSVAKSAGLIAAHEMVATRIVDQLNLPNRSDALEAFVAFFVGHCGAEMGVPRDAMEKYVGSTGSILPEEFGLRELAGITDWVKVKATIKSGTTRYGSEQLFESMAEACLDLVFGSGDIENYIAMIEDRVPHAEIMLEVAMMMGPLFERNRKPALARRLSELNLACQTLIREA
jgi:hypothetical protein